MFAGKHLVVLNQSAMIGAPLATQIKGSVCWGRNYWIFVKKLFFWAPVNVQKRKRERERKRERQREREKERETETERDRERDRERKRERGERPAGKNNDCSRPFVVMRNYILARPALSKRSFILSFSNSYDHKHDP